MTMTSVSDRLRAHPGDPVVRSITTDDLIAAVKAGYEDFKATPTHAVFLVAIYPIIGLVLARLTLGEDLFPLAYPLVSGFALIGPLAALGLYEISRRREQGLDQSALHAFDILKSPSIGSIVALGILQMLIFLVWVGVANSLYAGLFAEGARPHSIGELIGAVFTTGPGWALLILGNGIGLLFAIVSLATSVVSFPLLLDRPVSATTALTTSLRAVRQNPRTMAIWGLVVAISLVVGSIPFFLGLAVVLPILGHATWHLYRRIVAPVNAT